MSWYSRTLLLPNRGLIVTSLRCRTFAVCFPTIGEKNGLLLWCVLGWQQRLDMMWRRKKKLPKFSQRTEWKLAPNRLTQELERVRVSNSKLLDLTVSNPTR